MTDYIILVLCLLVLLAYLFDITSKYSKIPGVILLIGLGIGIQILVNTTGFKIPDMKPLLPVIGTLGLILIVMEASLDLKLGKHKFGLIIKSASAAFFLFTLFAAVMSFIMVKFLGYQLIDSLLNAIPFGIISSAVAISSTGNLNQEQKEFVVYESSLSDVIGILVFDFILIYGNSIGYGLISFTIKGLLTIIIAVLITSALAFLLHKITFVFFAPWTGDNSSFSEYTGCLKDSTYKRRGCNTGNIDDNFTYDDRKYVVQEGEYS